ncbi:class I SAM-dependent methyltransferase [uncultured Jatrophihabitans sp.]|uniref:class I SAM-dependent methyltransferase n=1 Tax=uncultured Jatrophihabitans sp. TaxID=1610747 RepID=UPI0035CBF1F7
MRTSTRRQPAFASVLRHYEHALRTGSPLDLRGADGGAVRFDVRPWLARADDADQTVVRHCTGPTLDVGCGPGRLVAALQAHGVDALGVDVSPAAVAMTRRRGAPAVLASVFEPMPREGEWATVVLLDGNIGIGGDPLALLRRTGELLRPGGHVVVETARDPAADERLHLRVPSEAIGGGFRWANVGANSLAGYAETAQLWPVAGWRAGERTFAVLESVAAPAVATAVLAAS